MLRKAALFFIALGVIFVLVGGAFAVWGYFYVTRDLPPLLTAEEYKPQAVSKVFSSDGTLIGEFFRERRYPVSIKEVPEIVKQAFIAAEDSAFYSHPGLDPLSILRALIKNIQSGEASQGGSTITQQVVKNLLLTSEKKLTRKIKEAILSYRIEKQLTKDEILGMYLNQIFFGNTAYGIRAACEVYFRKPLSKITLAEAALLAGLPKAPSRFSPISNMPRAKQRQRYVLDRMVQAGFITKEMADAAYNEDVKVYQASLQNFFEAPYYLAEVRRILQEEFRDLDIDGDGLEIYTPLDLTAQRYVRASLRKGLRDVDKRRGYRGPVAKVKDRAEFIKIYKPNLNADVFYGMVVGISKNVLTVDLGSKTGILDLSKANWVGSKQFSIGDVIECSILKDGEVPQLSLEQTPELEGAAVIINPKNGDVIAMQGGYSYQRNQFNRVTQALRQPGSAFKPIVYLAAIDSFNYNAASIVSDAPRTFRIGDTVWSPGNFDETFLGNITLRVALEKSRNLVSVDIVSRIGLTPVIKYASLLGIQSPLGRNLSISLGSSEVTVLELTRAYGVFPAEGVLFPSNFITKIVDRNGKVIYSRETITSAKQVISRESAFLMSYMMQGVVQSGTATSVKALERPAAGKTGTTNDFMDAWFIGFTPDWVAGVWVGFDQKKKIGNKETGGRISAPIWLGFMKPFIEYQEKRQYEQLVQEAKEESKRLGIDYEPPPAIKPSEFRVPEGVEPFWIDKATGYLSTPNAPGAILEYFKKGTKPRVYSEAATTESYLDNPEF